MAEKISIEQTCDQLGEAVASGNMGDIVAKHEKMILGYYEDVKQQANQSFALAKSSATIGFVVIIFSLAYLLICDALARIGIISMSDNVMTISSMSLIAGGLIEFISAVAFWLYSRGARQFGAFHICLERTHRYLLAFKIAEETGKERDKVMGSLVCIMANAPMISRNVSSTTETADAALASRLWLRPNVGLVQTPAAS